MNRFLFVQVSSYDESTDKFTIGVPVIEHNEPGHKPECLNADFDLDDQEIDATLFGILVGEFGEPDEFIGRWFKIQSPRVPAGCPAPQTI